MATNAIIFIDNTSQVTITGLKAEGSNTFENSASVEVTTITDSAGNEVTGETFPISADYVSASNGDYVAVISADLDVISGGTYTTTITATAGSSVATWNLKTLAQTR